MYIRIERDGFVLAIETTDQGDYNVMVFDPENGLIDEYWLPNIELVAKLVEISIKSASIKAEQIELAYPKH